ncbi:hypothetical protein BFP72_03975 [Reichenbachiella sp. 5M10]|uniref:exopolysaccharide transport family protein n=1 Tax=Reichenbachiella sp. 5M10 TaxID=1889772 RepID=UPI000C3E90AF|nr:Wzz/FepE/Etk N-terminal domain-containing protein [Reichenbachiella sp. 5M10]PIB34625.1 hypothetical protein BFP72_03975 [Reichenbachiella sp. 5M10]
MEFQELFKVLNRKKLLLFIIPLISAAIAFALRFASERYYVSESQISTGLTIANDFSNEKNNISPFQTALNFGNLIENMASKMVVNNLSYKLLYRDLSSDEPFRRPKFEEDEYISAPTGEVLDSVLSQLADAKDGFKIINRTNSTGRYIFDLLEMYKYDEKELLSNVSISRIGNTDFINIRYSSEVPGLSAYVVNLWADTFIDYYDFQKNNRLNESLGVLSQILEDKQDLLSQNIAKLNRYRSRYMFMSSNPDSDPIGEYERLIREKESNIRSINYRLQNLRGKIAETDKTSSYNGRKRIIKLKNDIDRLSSELIAEPKNKVVRDSLDLLRGKLQSEMYMHTSTSGDKVNLDALFDKENELKVEYEIALVDLQKLYDQFAIEKGAVQSLANTKSVLENIETEVKQSRDEMIAAQDKYNQARSELLAGSSAIKLSYYGDIPEDPQSRKTIMFTALGLVIGFVITLFMILAFEFLDQRIKNPIKFKRETKMDASGYIQSFSNIGKLEKILVGDFSMLKEGDSTVLLQSLRKLRYNIQDLKGSIFLFTSLREGSGKSFLLTALAFSLSLVQKKVLIIDTNFRSNALTNGLGNPDFQKEFEGFNVILKSLGGKPMVVNEKYKMDFSEGDIISKTNNPYVFLMKGQNIHQSPEEIFSKLQFSNLLGYLKERFDFIFIEGAALNLYSDSKELSRYADYIVPVFSVEDEFTSRDQNSMQFFEEVKGKLSLKVLNKVRSEDVI